ncbi:MAG: glycosyltransferase family 39 protein [Acidimicrobiia bacterium]|nr:glycosyltransferase family 39 protein [Acidimicrobiia bacterium]
MTLVPPPSPAMSASVEELTPVPAPPTPPVPPSGYKPKRGLLARLFLGQIEDPPWVRPCLLLLLGLSAALNIWALDVNGTGNEYYAAAILSGTKSWKAFFYGALDSSSFITVDKPPLALWVMGLSARVFGFSTWSLLLPQALMGVASVGVLYATVRRAFGASAGLLAGLVLTLTPVVVVMNRYNNPDALLMFLLVLAAWATVRAIQSGRTTWLLLAMVFVGLGFNTKMLQAWMVVPALGLAYLVAAKPRLRTRILQLGAAGLVAVAVSATWMVVVDSIPADSRPYIGGSQDGTVWDLVLGYNGLGRIFGRGGPPGGTASAQAPPGAPAQVNGQPPAAGAQRPQGNQAGSGRIGAGDGTAGGPGAPGGGRAGFGGQSGWLRLFNEQIGDQISWLIPLALLCLAVGLYLTRRSPRTDLARASLILWGVWVVVHGVVFSLAEGGFHPYYTNVMGPAIGALVGGGVVLLWRRMQDTVWPAWVLAGGIIATSAWSAVLLGRAPGWNPWLVPFVLLLGVAGGIGLVVWRMQAGRALRVGVVICGVAFAGALLGGAAYATTPLSIAYQGGDPVAGPASTQGQPGDMPPGNPGNTAPPLSGRMQPGPAGRDGAAPGNGTDGGVAPGRQGREYREADAGLVSFLQENWKGTGWLVATAGSHEASPIILATGGLPVMAMGGFSGNDPALTTAELAQYVESGELRFVLVGGNGPGGNRPGGPGPGARGQTSDHTSWVQDNCSLVDSTEYGGASNGARLYDCS